MAKPIRNHTINANNSSDIAASFEQITATLRSAFGHIIGNAWQIFSPK
jgi:hypothetical protein